MRVTRESLVRIAKETAQERAYNDRDITAVYATGALAREGEPMLGGTADIDLVFVHAAGSVNGREIIKLTPDFHLDISHRAKSEYKSPRELRGDPWLGWEMFAPMYIYEREKFFDFTVAAVRGGNEFEGAQMTLTRCRKLLAHGRQIWMDITDLSTPATPEDVWKFLKSLFHAGNAVMELNGPPVYERRFLLEFPDRARDAGRAGMGAGMLGLLGAAGLGSAEIIGWVPMWRNDFTAAVNVAGVDPRINPARLNYYEKAINSTLEGDDPRTALWPLLNTWTLAAAVLPAERRQEWAKACQRLGLADHSFSERAEGLDQYLDEVEILLDEVSTANGLEAWNTGS